MLEIVIIDGGVNTPSTRSQHSFPIELESATTEM